VRLLCLVLALLVSAPLAAQEKKAVKKKPVAAKKTPHQKPTPEQIRKFNELQKKQ